MITVNSTIHSCLILFNKTQEFSTGKNPKIPETLSRDKLCQARLNKVEEVIPDKNKVQNMQEYLHNPTKTLLTWLVLSNLFNKVTIIFRISLILELLTIHLLQQIDNSLVIETVHSRIQQRIFYKIEFQDLKLRKVLHLLRELKLFNRMDFNKIYVWPIDKKAKKRYLHLKQFLILNLIKT